MPVGNPVTDLSTTGNFVPVTRTLTINGVSYDLSADRSWSIASPGGGSVTSVAMSVPVGFSISGSPITTAGTLAVTFASGYALPTTVKQSNWDDAYTFVSNFPSQTGNNGKFLYTSGSVLSWQPVLQNPMSNYGEMIFGGTSGVPSVVSPNITVNRQYLQQIGNGTAAFAPSWGGIISSDITGQALTSSNDTNVQITLGGTPGNSVLNAVSLTMGWTGQLSAGRGGTGTSGVTGIMLGNATAPVTGITGIGGQILRVNPSTSAYEFWTSTYLESPMTTLGDIIYGGAGGQPLRLGANNTANNMYLRSVSSGIPSWASIQGADIVGAGISRTNDTNVQITLGGATTDGLLRAVSLTMGWTGQLSVPRGGTGVSTITGVVIGNGTGVMTGVVGTAGQLIRRDATNSFYEFFTPTYLSNPMTTLSDIIVANAAGAPIRLAANTTADNLYLRTVSGAIGYAAIQGSHIVGAGISRTNDTNVQITLGGATTDGLLRAVTLTMGWTGQLAVGRGGTGASTLTGVLIGNGTSAVSGVTGTSGQLLRRNVANTAYEFFTASLISGNGVADRVAKWTSSTNLIDGQIVDNGTNVSIGTATPQTKFTVYDAGNLFSGSFGGGSTTPNVVALGTTSSVPTINGYNYDFTTHQPLILQSTGQNVGIGVSPSYKLQIAPTTVYSALNTGDGFAIYNPSLSGANLILGINGSGSSQGALIQGRSGTASTFAIQLQPYGGNVGIGINPSHKLDVDGTIGLAGTAFAEKTGNYNVLYDGSGAASIYIGGTSANLNAYSNTLHSYQNRGGTVEFATISGDGLNVKIGRIQLPSTNYLTWGGAYGANIPTIQGTSGTGAFLSFSPSGSSSGEKMKISDNGQIRFNGYTSTSSFSGLTVGLLGFTSTGAITTYSIPGGVSGTQDYLAKFDSTGVAVANSRIVDNGTNFLFNSASAYVTGLNLIGDIGMQSASGQASSLIMRSNQTPTSGTTIGIIDSYAITTGSTYQIGGGIEFRASQNWNSTSAGTNIFVQTAPDNTIAPADMFVFLNNGAVRFIGRTSNPIGAAAGTMYYNSSANNMRYYNGTSWITF